MPLAPGSSFGPYRIIEPLGKGGMAAVYRAYEAGLDRYVALKVLPAEFLHETAFAERFRREAKVIARLEHPHIVPIYAYGIDQDIPWMAMRLIAGGPVSSLLRAARMEPAAVVPILRGVADALDYAHVKGVLHRDVKPQNVLLDDASRVYLADFGIARIVEGSTVLTGTGMIAGTPQYMAPEQALGKPLDPKCDVYALGIVAYEMLTGRVPFIADTPIAVLMKHVSEPIPLPPEISEPILRCLLKCLAKEPGDRWSSATAFVDALQHGLHPAGGTTVASTRPATTVMPPRTAVTAPTRPVTREPQRIAARTATSARSRPLRVWKAASIVAGAALAVAAATLLLLRGGRHAATESPLAALATSTATSTPSPSTIPSAPPNAPAPTPEPTPSPKLSALAPSPLRTPPVRPQAPTPSPRQELGVNRPPEPTPVPPQEAVLVVRSNATGTTVTLDGREAGLAPAELRVPPGRHLVELAKADCTSVRHWVDVAAGERRRVELELPCPTPAPPPVAQSVAPRPFVPAANRPVVAVLDFDDSPLTGSRAPAIDYGGMVADQVVAALVDDGAFRVVERKRVDVVLAEQDVTRYERANVQASMLKRLGKILGVHYFITGTITRMQGKPASVKAPASAEVSLHARVIDVRSGEILISTQGNGRSSSLTEAQRTACQDLATKIAARRSHLK